MARAAGTVKWFSQEKGFGFVTREDGTDVFVHHSGISGRGFKTLEQGERVEFDIIEEPKGLKAADLVRLDAPTAGVEAGRDDGFGNRDPSYGNRGASYGNRSPSVGEGYGNRDAGHGNREGFGDGRQDWNRGGGARGW
jgi:cold shock protein